MACEATFGHFRHVPFQGTRWHFVAATFKRKLWVILESTFGLVLKTWLSSCTAAKVIDPKLHRSLACSSRPLGSFYGFAVISQLSSEGYGNYRQWVYNIIIQTHSICKKCMIAVNCFTQSTCAPSICFCFARGKGLTVELVFSSDFKSLPWSWSLG